MEFRNEKLLMFLILYFIFMRHDYDLENMEIVTVKNVDEVLKIALTKPFKRVEWVDVDQISKKDKEKKELSTH